MEDRDKQEAKRLMIELLTRAGFREKCEGDLEFDVDQFIYHLCEYAAKLGRGQIQS